ncbi:MAG TPA: ATP-binding protein [Ktedonobacteraceae bacterium]|nr:ATP-binding protein [Ktedonobacteraceae bacterium]
MQFLHKNRPDPEHLPWPLPVKLSVIVTLALGLILSWQLWLHNLFNAYDFSPHGYCYLWLPGLVTLHVSSDALIGLAYVSITSTLLYFVIKTRHDVPFQWIFIAFGLFIVACGATHFMEIVTLWYALYWLSGAVKLVTAVASVTTAIALPFMIPEIRAVIASAKLSEERQRQLEQAHRELQVLYQQSEDALHRSEQRYGDLIESLPLVVWTADAEGNVRYHNRYWYEYTGVDREQAREGGDSAVTQVHPDDRERILDDWKTVLRAGEPYETEYRLKYVSGDYRWQLARAVPIRDAQGHLTSWIGTDTDIEELKRVQKELEESEARKDAFLSMASHELKTPITSISGYTQVLKRLFVKEGRTQVVQHLSRMEYQIDRLVKLISDLLDISKIQAGKLEFEEEEFEVCAFIRNIVEDVQQISPGHTLNLRCGMNATLVGDKDRLGQAIINLLTNAIKFSPNAGSVDITVEEREGQAVFSVRDYGIGIPAAHQARIFERYYRVFDERDKKFPGLGIGLSIVAEVVRRHGGELRVESDEGQGATFSFALPLRAATPRALALPNPS